jgi:hypothetical protein
LDNKIHICCRVPPPNFMDIDAELDAAPLAWAGATVVTHGDAGVSSAAADAAAALDDPFAEAAPVPQWTQPPVAADLPLAAAHSQPLQSTLKPQIQPTASAVAAATPAAVAQPQPTSTAAPHDQRVAQQAQQRQQQPQQKQQQQAQRQQQQQQQQQRQSFVSVMDAAGPRRPMNLEPLRDPFAPSLAAQRPPLQHQQPPSQQPPQPAAVPYTGSQAFSNGSTQYQGPSHSSGGGGGGGQQRAAVQPDAAGVARARAQLSAQYSDGPSTHGSSGGGVNGSVWPPPGSPMSAAQQALDRCCSLPCTSYRYPQKMLNTPCLLCVALAGAHALQGSGFTADDCSHCTCACFVLSAA